MNILSNAPEPSLRGVVMRCKSRLQMPTKILMMADFGQSFRTYAAQSSRVFSTVQAQPSWVTRLAFGAALIVLLAVILLLVVPALVIGLIVFSLGSLMAGVQRRFGKLRKPNGAFDGRRNVRVITRSDSH